MANLQFWKMVDKVIEQADVVLEVLDARLIDETRNTRIEEKIQQMGKKLIHVINKIDLGDKDKIEKKLKGLHNPVFVSSKERLGTTILKKRIMEVGSKDKILVGVVGYPNVGKSSVINALAGSNKARTSPQSGHTRGIQKVKASGRIMLLDTPGVIPFEDNDLLKHVLIASKNPQMIKEPDLIAMKILEMLDGRAEKHYGVERNDDLEETLKAIALKKNKLLKGGIPNVDIISRIIITEWQRGILK
ncbi:MAG TPA: GTPase [Candidatus Nanoarchaeia archaeon]|nr:GTPase [Candidatus Nanoarchaeia archaeon]